MIFILCYNDNRMKYEDVREDEIKQKVARDFFAKFDTTQFIGNIDFCVAPVLTEKEQNMLFDSSTENKQVQSLLWAEAKRGSVRDINESFVQLILTIGKARTFDEYVPPEFLGAFDAEKIAFLPWHKIVHVFSQNDFNWNVTPSNHSTKEFLQLYSLVQDILDSETLLFDFVDDENELRSFIKANFKRKNDTLEKIQVSRNNFIFVYQKWRKIVMPTIEASWAELNKAGVMSADFFLADLLSEDNKSLKESLLVVLRKNEYQVKPSNMIFMGKEASIPVEFNDGQKAHIQFWNIYERPPKKEYWNYMIERRDLLVPNDVRERKGSFFTPQMWVQKSQEYFADVLGDKWQDEYVIWDCCAGTGNLLNGLTNKSNIWASTIDKADVDVMKELAKAQVLKTGDEKKEALNLFEDHIFQFDFLNDDFSTEKLPKKLYDIISDAEKRKKLVIYINPPYAEVSSKKSTTEGKKSKAGVNSSRIHDLYFSKMGTAARELYIQFLARIYFELSGCIIGEFSTLKLWQGSAFEQFRSYFKATLEKMFIVPSWTFDNVKGKFPIGFFVWNTYTHAQSNDVARDLSPLSKVIADVFDAENNFICHKLYSIVKKDQVINNWISQFKIPQSKECIGFLDGINGNDFQHNNYVYIKNSKDEILNPRGLWVSKENLIACAIYFAIRQSIEATWLNDRDQFLYPSGAWESDYEFQFDCLVFTLFHSQNRITSEAGVNNWIPFTEDEVGSAKEFESHFMSSFLRDFIAGTACFKNDLPPQPPLLAGAGESSVSPSPARKGRNGLFTKGVRSSEAAAVFEAGKELWSYYFTKRNININASFYDIRRYFQGEKNGRMNSKSENDEHYNELLKTLRDSQKNLAAKIAEKVYKYGFLRQ